MSPFSKPRRPLVAFIAASWCTLNVLPPLAAQQAAAAPVPAAPSTMQILIDRLVERGVLTKQDGVELNAQAAADAADARVQAVEALLAAAKADAAVARAQAAAVAAASAQSNAQAAARALIGQGPQQQAQPPAPAAAFASPAYTSPVQAPAAQYAPAPSPAPNSAPVADTGGPTTAVTQDSSSAPQSVAPQTQAPAPAASTPLVTTTGEGGVPTTVVPDDSSASVPTTVVPTEPGQPPQTVAPANPPAEAVPAPNATANGPVPDPSLMPESVTRVPLPGINQGAALVQPAPVAASAPSEVAEVGNAIPTAAPAPAAEAPAADEANGTVRVAYVPEVVKNEIKDEVKDEVLAEEKQERWAGVQKVPEWVSRITLFGDVRVREEEIINHSGNNTTGAFPNFNAINTGQPFDTAGNLFSPQYDVNQNRNRLRFRTRVGAAVDLSNGFTAGVRIASGNDDNPVTENQTMGAVGPTGQGGNFSKYQAWIDLAYLKYQTGGDPTRDLSIYAGRFTNPFFSTSLMWANDLNFDGVAVVLPARVHLRGEVVDKIKPFIVAGAFPVYNTDLNFATNQPAKYASYDKWLEAVQAGFNWQFTPVLSLKFAGALYNFKNIQGQLSTPFTPVNISENGSTDDSRPGFAQNGNTYMPLRDIVPDSANNNGAIDQWQYYGLATGFRDLTFTEELDYDEFSPFRISLVSEYARNLDWNKAAVSAIAVNNLGAATTAFPNGVYAGGNVGWISTLRIGNPAPSALGDWNLGIGYRSVQSDAVVDGFTDADFGGVLTGTNLKGPTIDFQLALARGVWFQARLMSATAIIGPAYRNDLLQLDINGKF